MNPRYDKHPADFYLHGDPEGLRIPRPGSGKFFPRKKLWLAGSFVHFGSCDEPLV